MCKEIYQNIARNEEIPENWIDSIIGSRNKWKKLPLAFKQLKEDFKTKQKWVLISIFLGVLMIVMLFIYAIYTFQINAQYCDLGTNGGVIINMGMPYSWFLEQDKEWGLDIICKWDIKKYWREHFGR